MNYESRTRQQAISYATLPTNWLGALLLLAMRGYWGYLFILAGAQKLAQPEPTAAFFSSLGIPLPSLNAYLVGLVETLCGLILAVGYQSRAAAGLLSAVMLVAYATAHRPELMALFQQPSQFVAASPFQYLLTCLLVLAFGPGRASLDQWLERKLEE